MLIPRVIVNATEGNPNICAGLEARPDHLIKLQLTLNGDTNVVRVAQRLALTKGFLLKQESIPRDTPVVDVVCQSPCS
jgi:hypothetical protein